MKEYWDLLKIMQHKSVIGEYYPSCEYNEFVRILKLPDAPKLGTFYSRKEKQHIILISAATAFAGLNGISTTEFLSHFDAKTKDALLKYPKLCFYKSKDVVENFLYEHEKYKDEETGDFEWHFDPIRFKQYVSSEEYASKPFFYVRMSFKITYNLYYKAEYGYDGFCGTRTKNVYKFPYNWVKIIEDKDIDDDVFYDLPRLVSIRPELVVENLGRPILTNTCI